MQQQVLFATCLGMDISDGLLVTAMVVAMDRYGWMTFSAMEQK